MELVLRKDGVGAQLVRPAQHTEHLVQQSQTPYEIAKTEPSKWSELQKQERDGVSGFRIQWKLQAPPLISWPKFSPWGEGSRGECRTSGVYRFCLIRNSCISYGQRRSVSLPLRLRGAGQMGGEETEVLDVEQAGKTETESGAETPQTETTNAFGVAEALISQRVLQCQPAIEEGACK